MSPCPATSSITNLSTQPSTQPVVSTLSSAIHPDRLKQMQDSHRDAVWPIAVRFVKSKVSDPASALHQLPVQGTVPALPFVLSGVPSSSPFSSRSLQEPSVIVPELPVPDFVPSAQLSSSRAVDVAPDNRPSQVTSLATAVSVPDAHSSVRQDVCSTLRSGTALPSSQVLPHPMGAVASDVSATPITIDVPATPIIFDIPATSVVPPPSGYFRLH